VGRVGLVIEALEDSGSTDGSLERMEDSDALGVGNAPLGGELESTGISSFWLGRSVASVSVSCIAVARAFSFSLGDRGLDRGDFVFASDPFRSRPSMPFPSRAVFLNEPFLLRVLPFCWTRASDPPDGGLSSPSFEDLSEALLERNSDSLDRMLPGIERLCVGLSRST
jgi:hypothetical protein